MTSPAFTQITFRLRYDDNTEADATWRAAENTNATVNVEENFRVRVRFDETASRSWSNQTFTWQYQKNGSGGYANITGSTPVRYSLSDNFANGADCTSKLSGGSGTFVTDNNGMLESSAALTNSGSAGYLFETEICLQLDSTQMANGDYVDVRLSHGSYSITYSNTPRITASKIAPTATDGLTLGESKTITVSELSRTVTDGVALGEDVSYFSENIWVGESVSLNITSAGAEDREITKSDNITLGDTAVLWTDTYHINVNDGLTVGDTKSVENTTLYRSVSDGLTVGESKTVENTTLLRSVSDGLTVGESKTVENTTLYRSVTDGLTVGDSKTVENTTLYRSSTDGLTVTDTLTEITTTSPEDIEIEGISDNITVGDTVTVTLPDAIGITVSDGITVADTLTNIQNPEAGAYEIIVSDGVTLGDNLHYYSEDILVGESVTVVVEQGDYAISKTDDLTVGESKTVQVGDLVRSITDGITLGDTVTIMGGALSINATDGVTVGDSKTVENSTLYRSTSDGLTVGESQALTNTTLYRSTSDGITVGESQNISVGAYVINVTDGITVGESNTLENTTLYRGVSDGLTVSDSKTVEVSSLSIQVTDAVSTADVLSPGNVYVGSPGELGSLSIYIINNVYVTDVFGYYADNVRVHDFATVLLGSQVHEISVTDNVVVNDSVEQFPDDVVIGEEIALVVSSLILNASDGLVVGETPEADIPDPNIREIETTDNIDLGEDYPIITSDPQIDLSDDIVLGEDAVPFLGEENTWYTSNSDHAVITDSVEIVISGLSIDISDNATVADTTDTVANLGDILAIDNSRVLDWSYVVENTTTYANATESISLSEYTRVIVELPAIYYISIRDAVYLGEHAFTWSMPTRTTPDCRVHDVLDENRHYDIAQEIRELDVKSDSRSSEVECP